MIPFEGDPFSSDTNNLISANENLLVVAAKIGKELEAHRLAGPFSSDPLTGLTTTLHCGNFIPLS